MCCGYQRLWAIKQHFQNFQKLIIESTHSETLKKKEMQITRFKIQNSKIGQSYDLDNSILFKHVKFQNCRSKIDGERAIPAKFGGPLYTIFFSLGSRFNKQGSFVALVPHLRASTSAALSRFWGTLWARSGSRPEPPVLPCQFTECMRVLKY